MSVVLISTYDLGRQPFGLASPAAWLRREGVEVRCVDVAKTQFADEHVAGASLVAFYLPMHTATRLAMPLVARVRRVNPGARICAYGLYAQLNAEWLRAGGVETVLGPEAEDDLVALATSHISHPKSQTTHQAPIPTPTASPNSRAGTRRLSFIQPDRAGLPALSNYATLQMPDGTRRIVASTEASRGCKHLCRHCPIVPVYRGQFYAIPVDVVMADIASQVAAGAGHVSFGDPDFFNGPTHARRIVERLAAEHAGVTYDVTIKIEHLLKHRDLLPLLRRTGCLFVTSAVESVDATVLERLAKGHTRADFVRVVELCGEHGVTLSPTFVPFTPWTTVEGYLELLDTIEALDLVDQIAPIQLAIRLLVTAGSPLLDLDDIRGLVDPFDASSLTWPWRHLDARVDRLQHDVMALVGVSLSRSRGEAFTAIMQLARAASGLPLRATSSPARHRATVPYLDEPWYC